MAQTVIVGTNHKMHLIITLFTAGAWAPIWFLAWMANGFR